MLSAIRERATGWIAWVIVILISATFALWGINSYFEGGGEIAAARVNDQEISLYQYQQELANQRQALSRQLGENFDPAMLDSLGIKEQVIDRLIDDQLMTQYVAERNFRISDVQLQEVVKSFPAFQNDGQFSADLYQQVLRANQLTPQEFEQLQRLSTAVSQLQQGIDNTAFVTDWERERLLLLLDQERSAQYAVLQADRFVSEIEISDQEVEQYYADNLDQFETPEQIKLDYIELSVDALAENITPTEAEIEARYQLNSGQYRSAENRRVSHILFSVPDSASQSEREAILEQARSVLERARGDADFAALAGEFSDDPGSKGNGGDLGVIAPGQMVKPFEDAVFSMQEGDIAGPVESQFGYHIIKLTELQEGSQKPLGEVRDEVVMQVRQDRAEELFAELAESFRDLVFQDPDNLTTAAFELDLPVQTTGWITRNSGPGIGAEPPVRRAAFSEEVLIDSQVSPAIEIGFDRMIAIKKNQYEAASPRPLDQVRDEVVELIKLGKSRDKVDEMGKEILGELDDPVASSSKWQQQMEKYGLEPRTASGTRYDIDVESGQLAAAIFSHPTPPPGEVGFGGVSMEGGDYAVFMLDKVKPGNLAEIQDSLKTRVRQQLLVREGAQSFNRFREHLRRNAEVRVYRDQL